MGRRNCVKMSARFSRSSRHLSYDADAGMATQVGQIAYQLKDAKKKGNRLTPLQMALNRQPCSATRLVLPTRWVLSSKMVSGRFVIPSPDRDHVPLRLSGCLRRLLSSCPSRVERCSAPCVGMFRRPAPVQCHRQQERSISKLDSWEKK